MKAKSKTAKKTHDPLLKAALATTAANIARIEAAERGEAPPEGDQREAVPVNEIISAGSPKPRKGGKSKDAGEKSKSAKAAKDKPAKPAKADKPKKEKRMSGLDAAAKVLSEAKEPMNATDLVKVMAEKGYWSSPGGKTPHATIYAAMCREIKEKKSEARFVKKERGLFAANK